MSEARDFEFDTVWARGAIGDKVDTEFTFWSFGGDVDLSFRDAEAFGGEFEVMDEFFHRLFHACARGKGDFVVVDHDRSRGHAFDGLFHDFERLAHFFHTNEIAVVAVAVGADGDFEGGFGVGFIGFVFTKIPFHSRASKHYAGEVPGHGVFE